MGQANPHHRHSTEYKQGRIGTAWPEAIAQPTCQQSRKDRDRYRGNNRVSDLRLGEFEILSHYSHEWSDTKPSQKAQEEREPRQVKGAHWRTVKVQQANPSRLSIGIRLQIRTATGLN